MIVPLGIRNNNPGNIRPGADPWVGQTGVDSHNFCIFDTPEHGLRALAKQLLAYQDRHGLTTVAQMISRWAPSNENDTDAYIDAVADAVDVARDESINLHDADVLSRMVKAIVRHENGQQPYTESQLAGGVSSALA